MGVRLWLVCAESEGRRESSGVECEWMSEAAWLDLKQTIRRAGRSAAQPRQRGAGEQWSGTVVESGADGESDESTAAQSECAVAWVAM